MENLLNPDGVKTMTTLSEQDLELASKYAVGMEGVSWIFSDSQLKAFLAERDEIMKIQYWTRDLLYELESCAKQIGRYTPEFMRLIVEAKVAFQRDIEEREEQVRLLKKELLAIHEVVQCIGCVTEVLPTDSVTVKGVKMMAIRLNEASDKESELARPIDAITGEMLWGLAQKHFRMSPVAPTEVYTFSYALADMLSAPQPTDDRVREMEKDAERWRYFVETCSSEIGYAICGHEDASNEQINEAIDQAITSMSDKGGE